jgi:hypothetical protein
VAGSSPVVTIIIPVALADLIPHTSPATALWGFGAWRLATAAILLVRYLCRGRLPYGPGR